MRMMVDEGPNAANRTEPLGSARSVSFQWSTDSSTTLIYNGATISHGELASAPPAVIPPNSQALAGGMAVSDGFMTGKPRCSSIDDVFGTEGSFNFAVPGVTTGSPCVLTVKFNNPYMGTNEYSCSLAADGEASCGNKVFCAVGNGGGNDGQVLTTVWRA
ncbi:hypothetical protein N2152v2_006873 [Parachlorella kessleri]